MGADALRKVEKDGDENTHTHTHTHTKGLSPLGRLSPGGSDLLPDVEVGGAPDVVLEQVNKEMDELKKAIEVAEVGVAGGVAKGLDKVEGGLFVKERVLEGLGGEAALLGALDVREVADAEEDVAVDTDSRVELVVSLVYRQCQWQVRLLGKMNGTYFLIETHLHAPLHVEGNLFVEDGGDAHQAFCLLINGC
jgi:hypothetical protein